MIYSDKKHTIEGQSMSVREILTRFTRGENLSLIQGSPTFTERLNLDTRRMTKIELDQYYKKALDDVSNLKGNLTKQEKEKAILEAQERFDQAVERKAQELASQQTPAENGGGTPILS